MNYDNNLQEKGTSPNQVGAGNPSPAEIDARIYMAAERTFLAWIRTGIALMGFGFVVARFGLFLRELTKRTALPRLHWHRSLEPTGSKELLLLAKSKQIVLGESIDCDFLFKLETCVDDLLFKCFERCANMP